MTLGAPLGLLALLAVPAVVAAYFLRRKQLPRVVSALFLWRTPDQRAEAGPRFERFSREASLALELLALSCAALFLADARCGERATSTHAVVLVDGSLSMQASGGTSVAERVRQEVAALVRSERVDLLTIVESGVRPRVLAGPRLEASRAQSLLEAWVPAQPSHDLAPAFVMARELAGPGQRVSFFTDGPVDEAPPGVDGRSVGARLENVGFVSVQRRDEGGAATVTARVANFTDASREVPLTFVAKGQPVQKQQVAISSGATAVVRVTLATTERVEVTLPPDALGLDNQVSVLAAPTPTLAVSVLSDVGSAATPVTRALRSIDGVQVVDAAPTFTIGGPGSNASVRLGASGTLASFVGPFFAQKSHPMLDDVSLSGVVWTAGTNPPGRPLLSAGAVVLMSEDDDGVIHLNLELSRSNVQRSVAWPVLFGNLVRRARQSREGFPRRQVHLGEDVQVVTSAGPKWALVGPDGQARPVLSVGPGSMPPLPLAGTWKLERDGTVVDQLEVLALDAHESDLRTRGAWRVEAAARPSLASMLGDSPRPWPWVAGLLAALLVDFWLTARRRT